MTEHHDIAELRNLPEVELIELLPAVDAEKLTALRAAEAADDKPRSAVLEAIDKAVAAAPAPGARTDTEQAVAAGNTKPQTKAERKAAEKAAAEAAKQNQTPPSAPAAAGTLPAAQSGDTAPAWQSADYDGPLTIPQAEWRRANIKPVREAITK